MVVGSSPTVGVFYPPFKMRPIQKIIKRFLSYYLFEILTQNIVHIHSAYIIIKIMGGLFSKKEYVVATLNYSGLLQSPFEFFSSEMKNFEQEISDCFRNKIVESMPNFDKNSFDWNIGKIDKKLQTQRYSPIYRADAGLQNGKLINEKDFKQLWFQEFALNTKEKNYQFTEDEINSTFNFDFLAYKTIIQIVYKEKDLDKVGNLESGAYEKFMKKFFSKAYLNQTIKIEKVFLALEKRKVDISFFQEVTEEFLSKINRNEYYVAKVEGGQSVILLKKDKFDSIKSQEEMLNKLDPELRARLNWNQDTAICFADNLILISSHLSSKKQKNQPQIEEVLYSLSKLKELFPKHEIIVGMDANAFIKPEKLINFEIYPNKPEIHTTMKKRTWVQPQVKKAQSLASTCRDHLIASVKMQKARVVTIEDVSWEQVSFIPTEGHPHDHFVVTANIIVE